MDDVREEASASRRSAGLVMGLGAVAAAAIGRRMRYDLALQDFLAGPVGAALMGLLVAVIVGAALRWSGRDRDRRAFLAGAGVGTLLALGELVLADVYGWIGGTLVRPPLWTRLLVFGPHIFALALFPLALYRALARALPIAALLVYLGWVGFFSWATVPVERAFMAQGIFSVHNGFTVREDVLWGALFYLLALAAYLALRRGRGG